MIANFLMIFGKFSTIFRRFLEILQKLRHANVPELFRTFPITEDFPKQPKIAKVFRGNVDEVSIIKPIERLTGRLKMLNLIPDISVKQD